MDWCTRRSGRCSGLLYRLSIDISFSSQLIHIFSPLYLHEILGYSVQKTGWTAALPVLFHFFVKVSHFSPRVLRIAKEIFFKIIAGHSSDRILGVSETTKLRIYNSLALGLAGVFMAALAFVPKGGSFMSETIKWWGCRLPNMGNRTHDTFNCHVRIQWRRIQ